MNMFKAYFKFRHDPANSIWWELEMQEGRLEKIESLFRKIRKVRIVFFEEAFIFSHIPQKGFLNMKFGRLLNRPKTGFFTLESELFLYVEDSQNQTIEIFAMILRHPNFFTQIFANTNSVEINRQINLMRKFSLKKSHGKKGGKRRADIIK